jgi:hypothetical protein
MKGGEIIGSVNVLPSRFESLRIKETPEVIFLLERRVSVSIELSSSPVTILSLTSPVS